MAKKCRDCKKCTERGIVGLAKKAANVALITSTLGASVAGSIAKNSLRRKCPICGHPLTAHELIDGRFKD